MLARDASRITVWDVVQAVSGDPSPCDVDRIEDAGHGGSGYVVRQLAARMERQMATWLSDVTVADLVGETRRLRDAMSVMVGM